MKWKFIGESVIGTSHLQSGRICEDFISFELIQQPEQEILICCLSDGAGSAKYAADASSYVTKTTVEEIKKLIFKNEKINSASIYAIVELLYDNLELRAKQFTTTINEFSCTILGCILYEESSIFFQIGDGIIVREDNSGNYISIWLPQNGEYSNTTTFLIDDHNFGNLKILELNESINEIALTTDGLQMLILNNETNTLHQPFFLNLFKWLRQANTQEHINILQRKLNEYLSSSIINSRTDDDKSLFLATRIINE